MCASSGEASAAQAGDRTASASTRAALALTPAEVQALRAQFPYLVNLSQSDGAAIAYLDSAATAQRPMCVLDAERNFLVRENAAVHRGTSAAVGGATGRFEAARATVASFVGATAPEQIVWTAGATDALNVLALGIAEANAGLGMHPNSTAAFPTRASTPFALGSGDEILVTEAEHHANLIPWQRLAKKTGATLTYIPVDQYGLWSLDAARAAINSRTRIFAFSYVSNVTGFVAPVAELSQLARSVGALTVLDACQAVPHLRVNFEQLGVDFAAFSSHKMFGPYGLGVLYGRPELLQALPPARTGGSAITRVTMHDVEFLPPPHSFEAGTQPVSQAVGLAEAVTFLNGVGMDRAACYEQTLMERLVDGILDTPGLRLLGPQSMSERVALVSVIVAGVHAHDVGQYLDQQGVLVRVGHHCAQPLHRAVGVAASTRASVQLTTTEQEVDRFLAALRGAQRYFGVQVSE